MEITRLIKVPIIAIFTGLLICSTAYSTTVRVKDLAYVRGVRDNQLVGYGLVVGLGGTGDSNKAAFTLQSVASMLSHYGISVSEDDMKLKNVAAVMVTATIPAFAGNGDRLDVNVSSLGDAKSLEGGLLLQTPLQAGNGMVYAVAQGALTIGGFNVGSGRSSAQRNHTTVARVPAGAIVERDVQSEFTTNGTLDLVLRQADFTTAERLAQAINSGYGDNFAQARNAGTVEVVIPSEFTSNPVGFIAALENLGIQPDMAAKVVVNERTGTVVLGGDVRISTCAVSHGNLSITVSSDASAQLMATQMAMSAQTTQRQQIEVEEDQNRLLLLPAGAQVEDVVDALNAVGAGPRDIISVLQAIREAGALHAELVVM